MHAILLRIMLSKNRIWCNSIYRTNYSIHKCYFSSLHPIQPPTRVLQKAWSQNTYLLLIFPWNNACHNVLSLQNPDSLPRLKSNIWITYNTALNIKILMHSNAKQTLASTSVNFPLTKSQITRNWFLGCFYPWMRALNCLSECPQWQPLGPKAPNCLLN